MNLCAEFRMRNSEFRKGIVSLPFAILHSAFCILIPRAMRLAGLKDANAAAPVWSWR